MRERERRQRERRGEGIVVGERTYMKDMKAEMSMTCSIYTDHQHPWSGEWTPIYHQRKEPAVLNAKRRSLDLA